MHPKRKRYKKSICSYIATLYINLDFFFWIRDESIHEYILYIFRFVENVMEKSNPSYPEGIDIYL